MQIASVKMCMSIGQGVVCEAESLTVITLNLLVSSHVRTIGYVYTCDWVSFVPIIGHLLNKSFFYIFSVDW